MANIRKTFNFRNGVQVDEDNFIVDSLGKVGVGTTVPNEMLDVRGNVKVVGIITSQSLETRNVNIAGVTTFSGTTHVGSAITMYPAAGIISATQIHGDGSNLINIPTSQWTDVDVGLGFTSIYNAGYVGVSTVDPRFTFQVGGNNILSNFQNGVGINSSGNIVATGVITATNFKGDLQGAVTGNVVGNINSTGVSTISYLSGVNLNVTGIATANSFVGAIAGPVTGNVVGNVTGNLTGNVTAVSIGSTDITISGVSTFTGNIDANGDIDVDGHTELDNANVSGIITAVNAKVSTKLDLGSVSSQGISTSTPQSNLHVFASGISSIQVESGSSESILTLGRNVNQRQTSAEIVYAKSGLTYSDSGSLDVINYNNSHVNSIIHLGSQVGINTGSWNWIHGKDATNPKMTLTYAGNLGIGKTNAAVKLDVVGTSTVTNHSFVGGNSWVAGNQVVAGNLTVNGTTNINIDGKNLNVTTGHSKVKNLDVTANLTVVGFSTFSGNVSVGGTFDVGGLHHIDSSGNVAITTNTFSNPDSVGLDARHTKIIARGIGVGRTTLTAAVDFSNAGRNNYDVVTPASEVNRMYMYPPKVTEAERNALQGLTDGAIVFVTNLGGGAKLQVRVGSSWVNLH